MLICLALASSGSATIVLSSTATALSLTTTQVASLLTGIGLIKALALGAIAISALLSPSRSRRDVDQTLAKETDAVFNVVGGNEPHQCIQRLICDLATGEMPESSNDIMMALFEHHISEDSPMSKFAQAAQLGRKTKKIKSCEVQYSCPLTGLQIEEILA